MTHEDWKTEPNEHDDIVIPDELMPLLNRLGTQMRFHTISGKNEIQTTVDMVYIAQKFFTEHPELCRK